MARIIVRRRKSSKNSDSDVRRVAEINPTVTSFEGASKESDYTWRPINDIPDNAKKYKTDLKSLRFLWKEQSEKLKDSDALKDFNERLVRSWSIETGIIERLYDLDRGITETLVMHGFETSLIPHGSGVENPSLVIELLKDQRGALDLIFDYIKHDRPLTCSFIKELHSLFTKNQDYTDAVDQFGQVVKVPLIKGDWKQHPNNPLRRDGRIHEYAPPVHVQSEMDRLIALHEKHTDDKIAVEIQAAWLHHAFTQIHPFQDGNGRIARAIASFVFIKNEYFPLVVTRDDRTSYIEALEIADAGNLIPLIELFAKVQRRSFLQALGVSQNIITDRRNYNDVLENALAKLASRSRQENQKNILLTVGISKELESVTFTLFSDNAKKIKERLKAISSEYDSYAFKNNKGDKKSFYGHIIDAARLADYFADLKTYSEWVCLKIKESQEVMIVVAFHSIGRQNSGTFGAMPFLVNKIGGKDLPVIKLADEPFIFSYAHSKEKTLENYKSWLATVFSTAISEWGNRIS